jgi:ABC-type multidrug transport system fused ATPase/permease subunit
MQALFRMVQDKCHHGQIFIDQVDIDALGLNQLRSNLAIIPQVRLAFATCAGSIQSFNTESCRILSCSVALFDQISTPLEV